MEYFAKAIGVDAYMASLHDVKFESMAQLSEEQCKYALSIAVRKIADAIKYGVRFAGAGRMPS